MYLHFLKNHFKILISVLFLIISLLFYEYYIKLEYTEAISTSSGAIRGFIKRSSRSGRRFYNFLGVPYAEPPLGGLRFSSPKPLVKGWKGVRDAVRFGSRCMQVDSLSRTVSGSEDCLFLNVFVPEDTFISGKLLPIIFYIHGGYFMVGGSSYMGPDFLMDPVEHGVILVTVNYRLNVFGFLNTEDPSRGGNFGLKDQNLALKWVHQNAKNFGGDNQRITLAGQSAGSVAVHLHVLSEMSKGLFSAAIMSSGTAIKPWSLVPNPRDQATNLGNLLNCPVVTDKVVDCLRKISAEDITKAQLNALSSPVMDPLEIFAPSVENCSNRNKEDCFLSQHPYDILASGNFSKVPILTGVNSEEGLLATARMYLNTTLQSELLPNFPSLFPNFFVYPPTRTDLTEKILEFYFGENSFQDFSKFQNLTNLFSDRLYIHASRESVRKHLNFSSSKNPIYLYYFTYPLYRGMTYLYDISPDFPIFPQFVYKEVEWRVKEVLQLLGATTFKNEVLGVGHGDDIALIFKFPVFNLRGKDYEMSEKMTKMWTDFATNPNEMAFSGKKWTPLSKDLDLKYLLINGREDGSLVNEPFKDRMEFWDRVNLPWKL